MAILATVPRGSAVRITASFFDLAGDPAIPTSASYKVYCVTNSQEVKPTTALTPGQAIQITILPSENEILGAGNLDEVKQVVVTANDGLPDEYNQKYEYLVENIEGLITP